MNWHLSVVEYYSDTRPGEQTKIRAVYMAAKRSCPPRSTHSVKIPGNRAKKVLFKQSSFFKK